MLLHLVVLLMSKLLAECHLYILLLLLQQRLLQTRDLLLQLVNRAFLHFDDLILHADLLL